MSTTLSTTEMVARLKRKFPIGLGDIDVMGFLQEGFRKIDQLSKGGFIWQVRTTILTVPAGAMVDIDLPSAPANDAFDPGKTAWLRGRSTATSPTLTIIPYLPYKDFYNQQHFSTGTIGQFSAWTFLPALTIPTTYKYVMRLAPSEAFPTLAPILLDFTYHATGASDSYTIGAANYFPTPDQFDSFIVDLAEAELARVYGRAGWEKIQQQALQGAAEMIDTYRTERFTLAGVSDMVMQAQERQAEKTK